MVLALSCVLSITFAACGGETPSASKCDKPELLSRGAPATASGNAKDAKAVTDGNVNPPGWNAQGFPPQWVEIDLGRAENVDHVTLIPEQTPNGHTEHTILGTTADGETHQLGQLKGDTVTG